MTDSTRVKCHPYFKHWKPRSAKAADGGSTAAPSQNISWTVPNLCAAYNWPTGIESGGLIGIVELGGVEPLPVMETAVEEWVEAVR